MQRTVLVVEDDALMGDMVARVLSSEGFGVSRASSAAEALQVCQRVDPDAVVIDIDLGVGPDGFQLAEALVREDDSRALVFLTNLPDARFSSHPSARVLERAAYLRKSRLATSDELVRAIDAALTNRIAVEHRHDQLDARPLAGLTRKQVELLRLVSDGLTNDQIAHHNGTSVRAVERTLSRAFTELGIDPKEKNPRVEATRIYLRASMRGQ